MEDFVGSRHIVPRSGTSDGGKQHRNNNFFYPYERRNNSV